MRLIFFGSPAFAAKIAQYLLDHQFNIIGVVTQPDRPAGRAGVLRAPAVKELFLERAPQVPIFQPEKASSPDSVEAIRALQPDLFVVVAYGQILRPNLLAVPPLGSINVHASLLPKYRGAAPIQRALMAGESETGVSIIALAPEMDAGDVLDIERIPIGPEMTFGELEAELCELGKRCLGRVLHQLDEGSAVYHPQDHAQATFAPKLRAEETQIDWAQPAQVVHNRVRGLSPRPGSWTTIWIQHEPKRVKILRTRLAHGSGRPGELLDANRLIVACGSGAIELLELQSEGRKPLDTATWLRGIGNSPLAFHN